MRLTKTYDDGSFGVSDKLPCGENSYAFKELLINELGFYEDLFKYCSKEEVSTMKEEWNKRRLIQAAKECE